jgi:prevent-host-death family protein
MARWGGRSEIVTTPQRPRNKSVKIFRFRLNRGVFRRPKWEHAFVPKATGNYKGAVAEAKIAAAAIELGVSVLKPMSEHGRYDLVFDLGERLVRVQCKWANRKGDVVSVYVGGSYLSPNGYVRSTYAAEEVDAIAAYCGDLDRCYLLPIGLVAGQYSVHLRLAPARNGQRAGLHFADEHLFSGAVAQLGERRHGMAEATGSSPVSSIPKVGAGTEVVGAHDFRCLFGWYAQQAAAGHEILVTRRGKPYVRLVSARDQLDLERAAHNSGPAGP